ncbi:MAG: AraC family transcriptional regulator [Xanthomonadales bacterium]|nr:AraC family transcriptional regulator [Xanthomonadales bacterium]
MHADHYSTWVPADFHAFSEGRPQSFVFQQLSLEVLPARERYAFFGSEVLRGVSLARPREGQDRDFGAELVSMSNAGCALHAARTGVFECARGLREIRREDGQEHSLLYVRSGCVHADIAGDGARVAGAGEFLFLSGDRPTRLRFDGTDLVQMDLVGLPHAPAPGALAGALNRSPLRRLLRAQLELFPDAALEMDEAERVVQLASTEQVVLGVLQAVSGNLLHRQPERADSALFHAAFRYIGQHLHQPSLDPQQVAAALGCSRATLYRAFAAHGRQVAAVIRALRLQRAHELLRRHQATSIGDIAAGCGFFDLRSFHRAFRACFGCTPGSVREQCPSVPVTRAERHGAVSGAPPSFPSRHRAGVGSVAQRP